MRWPWLSHLAVESVFTNGQPEMAIAVKGSQPALYIGHVVSNGTNFNPPVGAVGVNVGVNLTNMNLKFPPTQMVLWAVSRSGFPMCWSSLSHSTAESSFTGQPETAIMVNGSQPASYIGHVVSTDNTLPLTHPSLAVIHSTVLCSAFQTNYDELDFGRHALSRSLG